MDSIAEIKQKINIEDLIAEYISLKKAGRNYKAVCPFHSEDTPSFMVSPELQMFKCFGCNEAGDIFNFIQKIEGVEFSQALELLAEKAGVKLDKKNIDPQKNSKEILYEINHVATAFYYYLLTKHKVGKEALTYVKKERGLSDVTIKEFKIGYAPKTWDSLFKTLSSKKFTAKDMLSAGLVMKKRSGEGFIDKFRGRVMFPISDPSGRVVGYTARTIFNEDPKYINTSETPIFIKSALLFGLDKAKIEIKKNGAILVEGPLDVISAYEIGVKNVVAPLGTSLTIGQLKVLSRYTKDVTLCFDNDNAGREAIIRAVPMAEKEGFNVKVALIPDEYKDLDEFVHADSSKVSSIFKDAVPVYDFFLHATLKKNNRHSSIGKKKIMEELIPLYSKISSPVDFDHYVKHLSEVLDITEPTVRNMIKKGEIDESKIKSKKQKELGKSQYMLSKKSTQEYMLALLLKAPLDSAQTLLYKLGQKDFTNPILENIFINLKNYLLGRKRAFNINSFSNKFDSETKDLVVNMYMWDLGILNDNSTLLLRELDLVFNRIKKETVKRELTEISSKIKQAELENDKVLLMELSKKFSELSEKLV
ncbi:MAG: DNA primase [Patescibacteria group bacterium]